MTTTITAIPRDAAPGLLAEISRFGRFSVLGFSLILPLAGAATVSAQVSSAQIAALLAVSFAFHIFGYVSNDVFDLPIDRTEPLRAGSPLVRGLVTPRVAFAIAMIPVPFAAALHLAAGGDPGAAAVLMTGMGLGWIYNAYGKKIAAPLVSDVVQAAAWVALALYGALTMRSALTVSFGWLAASVFLYVLLINGLHGGLRDIANDARHGAKTTAILLGARETGDGRLMVPRSLTVYGLALHVLILIAGILAVVERWPAAAIAIAIAHAFLLTLARRALRVAADRAAVVRAGFAHLFLSIGVVFVPFALFASRALAATIVAVYAIPVVVLAIRMTRRRIFAGFLLLAACTASADPLRAVTRQELVDAMLVQNNLGYNVRAKPNGARFNAGVILHLAREALRRGSDTPLLLDHEDYFAAYLSVTGLSPENAPIFISIARDYGEDQLIDFRSDRVIARVVAGTAPRLAVNVLTGWRGGAERYSYVDADSRPPLRVTRERRTSYRLLDFGDRLLFADIHGVSGRALGGLLGLIFKLIGDAQAVQSFSAIAADGVMVTLSTGRKGIVAPPATTATVWPDGHAEKAFRRNVPIWSRWSDASNRNSQRPGCRWTRPYRTSAANSARQPPIRNNFCISRNARTVIDVILNETSRSASTFTVATPAPAAGNSASTGTAPVKRTSIHEPTLRSATRMTARRTPMIAGIVETPAAASPSRS